jgi:uncharacterized protein YuzB (UPF0349 family)
MKNLQALTACLTLLCSIGCQKTLSTGEYARFIQNPENGLRIEKQKNGVKLTAQYKPLAFLALQNDPAHKAENISKNIKEIKGYHYFNFTIGSSDGHTALLEGNDSSTRHFNRLSYCEFTMQENFALVDGKDTLPCEMYHFERNYNLAPLNNFILAFPDKGTTAGKPNDLTLLYEDKLFDLGQLEFRIKASDIKNIPTIENL